MKDEDYQAKVKTPWTYEQINQRLKETQDLENGLNREVNKLSSKIRFLSSQKLALCKKISRNMRYQNHLLNLKN